VVELVLVVEALAVAAAAAAGPIPAIELAVAQTLVQDLEAEVEEPSDADLPAEVCTWGPEVLNKQLLVAIVEEEGPLHHSPEPLGTGVAGDLYWHNQSLRAARSMAAVLACPMEQQSQVEEPFLLQFRPGGPDTECQEALVGPATSQLLLAVAQ